MRDDSLSILPASTYYLPSTQVAYIMDVLRYREGALGAIWITLGLANLSMLVSEASFGGSNPILLSAAISLCSGSTLFIVGESDVPWISQLDLSQDLHASSGEYPLCSLTGLCADKRG